MQDVAQHMSATWEKSDRKESYYSKKQQERDTSFIHQSGKAPLSKVSFNIKFLSGKNLIVCQFRHTRQCNPRSNLSYFVRFDKKNPKNSHLDLSCLINVEHFCFFFVMQSKNALFLLHMLALIYVTRRILQQMLSSYIPCRLCCTRSMIFYRLCPVSCLWKCIEKYNMIG